MPIGDELRAGLLAAVGRREGVVNTVIDKKHIAPRPRRHIRIGAVQNIAIKNQYRSRPARGGRDAAVLNAMGNAFFIRNSIFLLFQRLLIMIFRRLSNAADELEMRSGNDHQRSVESVVVRKEKRNAQSPHPGLLYLSCPP